MGRRGSAQVKFAEPLPNACPPGDALDIELENVFRLAPGNSPSIDHFLSYAALGKIPPKALNDECRWASCSLTTDPKALKKLSKLKHRFAVKLRIPAGSGMSKRNNIHIDFWRSSIFDPIKSVESVEEV